MMHITFWSRSGSLARVLFTALISLLFVFTRKQILIDSHKSVLKPPQGRPGSTLEEAYFLFDYPPDPQTFVIQLNDPEKIQEARDILSGQQPNRHIQGTIVKMPAVYNAPWRYHLDPASISFFNIAIEVCDAGIQYVEDHLDEACGAFLPGCAWCPWDSRLLAEVTGPPSFPAYLPAILR